MGVPHFVFHVFARAGVFYYYHFFVGAVARVRRMWDVKCTMGRFENFSTFLFSDLEHVEVIIIVKKCAYLLALTI